jgi:hypothetical protein
MNTAFAAPGTVEFECIIEPNSVGIEIIADFFSGH